MYTSLHLLMMSSAGVKVGHGWRPPRALDIKGCSLIKQNLYLLVNSLKAKKNHYGGNTNLTSFNKWLFHYILCIFSYGFELQLGGRRRNLAQGAGSAKTATDDEYTFVLLLLTFKLN